MKYKLLLLDLDGTTVASSSTALPSARVIDAVKRAHPHIKIAIATGRPLHFAQIVIDKLELKGPGVFNGGAEIIEMATGEVLKSQKLDIPTLQELVRLSIPFGYKVYSDEDQISKLVEKPEEITKTAAKFFIEAVKTGDAIHILEQLNGTPNAMAHPTTSWESGDVVDIHVTHEHATKRHGAEQIITIHGFSKEEVIAVGDGYNDMPLLEAAGLKVAMGNAPDEVKQLADFIAPSQAEDGVAAVIEKYILGQ